ncbi:MAG: 2-C-methyl-D-erythritol 2,4-cyclodiphosphate synthase [Sphaerochaetaceae bacterium]
MRIGTGWDLHRLAEGRKLILGGIVIESKKGEVAHSDGDVLVHAIIDALLGSLALGDIGSHFPDTDPQYKDIDSTILLRKTLELIKPNTIENIDCTIILQEPKLRPYIDTIRANLARIMDLDISRISLKAKTTEHCLDEDVIIVQAMVLLSMLTR